MLPFVGFEEVSTSALLGVASTRDFSRRLI